MSCNYPDCKPDLFDRCHVRHVMDIAMPDSPTYDSFVVDTHLNLNQQNSNTSTSGGSSSAAAAAAAVPSLPPPVGAAGAGAAAPAAGHSPTPSTATTATVGSCRQRSVEQQQETAAAAALHSHPPAQPSVSTGFGASLQVNAILLESRRGFNSFKKHPERKVMPFLKSICLKSTCTVQLTANHSLCMYLCPWWPPSGTLKQQCRK